MRFWRSVLTWLLCCLFAGCGQGEFGALKKRALRGDLEAQIELMGIFSDRKNHVEALKWGKMAAEQGHRDAQLTVGMCYQIGHGVPKDDYEAARFLERSAEQGCDMAEYLIGLCYLSGSGVPQDHEKGARWWSKVDDPDVQALIAESVKVMLLQ